MILKLVFILSFSVYAAQIASAATDKVVCYHGIWSVYRQGNGHFGVEDIDPTLCTHLIYSFIGINSDGSIRHIEENLDKSGNIKKFNNLKLQNKNLKTLVAIGGWNEGTVTFSAVAADATKRARFLKSALDFVQQWGFDGFDIDWEFPNSYDKQNFALLLKEFREEFDKHNLLLTAAVSATPTSIDNSYDVPSLSKYLDLINVMAYDLHGAWDKQTGQNAPLYASPSESAWQKAQLNVDVSIKHWIQSGADPQKLTLGLGMYGRTYTLTNSANNGVGAPASDHGYPGPYTGQSGMLGYNEIVEKFSQSGWTTSWDDNQKNPFAYSGNQWVGYDNPKSIVAKMEYAKSLNLAGAMIWSIETDDFRGVSGTKFQLLRAINNVLGSSNEVPVDEEPKPEEPAVEEPKPEEPAAEEPKPEEPAAEEQVTEAPVPVPAANPDRLCTQEGYIRDPANCAAYIYCLPYNGAFVSFPMSCPGNLVYDPVNVRCDHKENVEC